MKSHASLQYIMEATKYILLHYGNYYAVCKIWLLVADLLETVNTIKFLYSEFAFVFADDKADGSKAVQLDLQNLSSKGWFNQSLNMIANLFLFL